MSNVYQDLMERMQSEALMTRACQELELEYEERVNVKDALYDMVSELLARDNEYIGNRSRYEFKDLTSYMVKAMVVAMAAKEDILSNRNHVRTLDHDDMFLKIDDEKDLDEELK